MLKVNAMVVAVALSVVLVLGATPVFASETGKTYFDLNMDNWTSESDWLNSDGTQAGFGWHNGDGLLPPSKQEIVQDIGRATKSLKFTMDQNSSAYAQARLNVSDLNFDGSTTLWTEFSIKYEGQFSVIGWDHDFGVAPLYIDETGSLYRFKDNYGNKSPLNYNLEIGKWYHIVAAMDFTKAPTGDGGPLYVWVNGVRIFNGTDYRSQFQVTGNMFKYIRFYANKPATGESKVYLDNFKFYTTVGAVDSHPESDYEVNLIDKDSQDLISINANTITVPIDTTVDTFKGAVTLADGDILLVVKGNNVLEDTDLINGATVHLNAKNGIGYKTYNVAIGNNFVPEEVKVDINFDRQEDTGLSWTNTGTESFVVTTLGHYSAVNWNSTLAKDVVKGSSAINMTTINNIAGQYNIIGSATTNDEAVCDNKTTWYEISLKYEEGILSTWFEGVGYMFEIKEDGSLYIGGLTTGALIGDKSTNIKIETGKWYHIVVAADNVNKWANTDTMYYAWVNGEEVITSTTKTAGCADVTPAFIAYGTKDRVWMYNNSLVTGAKIYIDDIKIYSTSKSVKDLNYNPHVPFIGAEITSDTFKVNGKTIEVPVGTTLADLESGINVETVASYYKNGASVSKDLFETTPANATTIFVQSNSGVGIIEYNVVEVITASPIAVTNAQGSVSSLKANDLITVVTDYYVPADKPINTMIVFAGVYSSGKLVKVSQAEISTIENGFKATAIIQLPEDLADGSILKVFTWESLENLTPIINTLCFPANQ